VKILSAFRELVSAGTQRDSLRQRQ